MDSQVASNDIYQDFSLFIAQFLKIDEKLENKILSVTESIVAEKGSYLFKEGEVNNYFYFIHTGAAHLYFHKGNKRITTGLVIHPGVLTNIDILNKPKPAKESLEILEKSKLLRIHYDDMQKLYDESKDFERLGRIMISRRLEQVNKYLLQTHFLSAKERYNKLITKHPDMLYRIPLGVVASYLGISQETLSRIRNPKYGKKKTS